MDNVKSGYLLAESNIDESLFAKTVTFIILINNLIPISLMVTIDIVRFVQGVLMENDERMELGGSIRSQARSANLNETLGMVRMLLERLISLVGQETTLRRRKGKRLHSGIA